jgi:ribosomal protein S18 acetylase RimI-like enzyme
MSEIEINVAIKPADPASSAPAGHNGGPPLDDPHTPEWGNGGIGNYFHWKRAHRAAWHNPSPGIVAFRIRKAERLGLTYEEYTLEILERGRHLQIEDVERIAQIKQARLARAAWNRAYPVRPEPTLMPAIQIKALQSSPDVCAKLGEMLVETVANGGSVSFMHPLPLDHARAFWKDSLASAGRGERIVLGAFDGDALIGTVTLLLNLAPNQPHRAEIAKMMTRLTHRHRGVATALLHAAEQLAIERGRTLLVLDTAVEDGASKLYERLGFQLTGIIPDYALKPHGGLTGTMIYWKRIAGTAAA